MTHSSHIDNQPSHSPLKNPPISTQQSPISISSAARLLQSPLQMVRLAGLVLSVAYATFIIWLYAAQPQTVAEVTGSVASGVGAYQVDPQSSADGMAFFYRDAFPEARAAFERADPAHRDARTQFYIPYSYYRQGWGRVYDDDELFRKGIEAVDRAMLLA